MAYPQYDVAVIGGGPSGSATAAFLLKHSPNLKVAVLERETFPRDHVGESLLPLACVLINEMGCWDSIEAANFPVKIGATYRWGTAEGLWDLNFLLDEKYEDPPRPARFEGQRTRTALQVDRAVFDEILLNYAQSLGAEVRQNCKVAGVPHEGDTVTGLELGDGSVVTARHYVDASGNTGILRKALGIKTSEPSVLRNVAFWDYWQNAEWAVNIGASGTRIQVRSLDWGWIWFIPISPTRTSVGLVLPAEYYKNSGLRPEDLYIKALKSEEGICALLEEAVCENRFSTTRDWSFLSDRIAGENWFLVGESAGFADPILSAGITISLGAAKEAAFTILELDHAKLSAKWLREEYERRTLLRLSHHIRFADYWYTANSQFLDLIEFTSEIAKDAGLELDGWSAWRWLSTGGFVDDEFPGTGIGGFSLAAVKDIFKELSQVDPGWTICKNNQFLLSLEGAEPVLVPRYWAGRVLQDKGYRRNGKTLPGNPLFTYLIQLLHHEQQIDRILWNIENRWCTSNPKLMPAAMGLMALQGLEALVNDGWVTASYVQGLPLLDQQSFFGSRIVRANVDNKHPGL